MLSSISKIFTTSDKKITQLSEEQAASPHLRPAQKNWQRIDCDGIDGQRITGGSGGLRNPIREKH